MNEDFILSSGVSVLVEPSATLPLVDVSLVFRTGARADEAGLEGTTHLTARLMRRGPRGMGPARFDEALDALGSSLGISTSCETVRLHGTVLERNLTPYLELLARTLATPALRPADFAREKRRALAELASLPDHDRALAGRAFRRALFRKHAYARPVSGTLDSVARVRLDDVKARHASLVRAGDLLVGVSGAIATKSLQPMLESALGRLPSGQSSRRIESDSRARVGRHIVVVNKPGRTQTQLYVGSLGIRVGDPDHPALAVANAAFGGTFTSRLVKEVRSERGWSYGASSRLSADRCRDTWTMWTHPGADQVADCLALQLDLLERWASKGCSATEISRTKAFLEKSHAFDLETPGRRLDPRLEAAAYDLPADWHLGYLKRIRSVSRRAANQAVARWIDPASLTIALVATLDSALERRLKDLPGLKSLTVLDSARV